MAFTIAIASHKGGTGKTVSSLALGSGLARRDKKTLLVDLDPQGHCSSGIGVELADDALTIRHLFNDPPTPIEKIITTTPVNGLSIVPSDIRLSRTEKGLYGRTKKETLLEQALQPIKDDFDYIIMDCAPSLGVLTEAGITAADFVVVPCQMEARAVDGLVDLLELIEILKGKRFKSWSILKTRIDPRRSVMNKIVAEQLEEWSEHLFETKIPQNEPLNQAQLERVNIYDFDAKSPGAQAYEELTNEILSNHHG